MLLYYVYYILFILFYYIFSHIIKIYNKELFSFIQHALSLQTSTTSNFQDLYLNRSFNIQVAKEFGFNLEVFPDDPLPDIYSITKIFNQAAIVVAPHGAGLSNLLYSEPGTIVIESQRSKFIETEVNNIYTILLNTVFILLLHDWDINSFHIQLKV